MVQFKLDKDWELAEEEIAMLKEAEKTPIKFDEDCPESTPEMLERFAEERRANPLPSHVIIPVSPTTEKLIKAGGAAGLTKSGKWIEDDFYDFLRSEGLNISELEELADSVEIEYMRKVEIYDQLAIAETQLEFGENIDGFAHLNALKNKYGL